MAKPTTIRMTPITKEYIDKLIDLGFGQSRTDIINLAVDRMYQQEVNKTEPEKPKAWSVVFDK